MTKGLRAWIIHEQPTAVADNSKNTVRAPFRYSTCCRARLRVFQSAPPCVFTILDTLVTPVHE